MGNERVVVIVSRAKGPGDISLAISVHPDSPEVIVMKADINDELQQWRRVGSRVRDKFGRPCYGLINVKRDLCIGRTGPQNGRRATRSGTSTAFVMTLRHLALDTIAGPENTPMLKVLGTADIGTHAQPQIEVTVHSTSETSLELRRVLGAAAAPPAPPSAGRAPAATAARP